MYYQDVRAYALINQPIIQSSARDDIGKTDEGNSSSLLRVLEPVCRIVSARKTDIVGIAWIPRCARPPRQTHSNRQPPSQLYNDEDDAECLLAVTLANDPFVYLYDAESWMGRHFAVFEHADGRTHGGSNSSIMYIRSAASLRGGGGSQRAPQLHFILTGSWSGHIRMWNFNDFKRPLWTVPGDPLGAAEQLGCVVSLHCIVLSAEDAYREKKMSGGRKVGAMVSSRSSEIDPYAITDDTFYGGSTASRPASVDLQVVVSVTSRGVLCLWDISEENCRGNLPAFGCDAAYHPINLCRVDIISLLGGGRDAVVGVSVTSGLNGARAVIKFSSMSIICISLPDCRVIYCNRLIRCALGDEICNDVCVLPVGSAPVGSEVSLFPSQLTSFR